MGRGYPAAPCVPDGYSNMSSVPGQALSYPGKILLLDVCLLFLMAVLETLRLYWGEAWSIMGGGNVGGLPEPG